MNPGKPTAHKPFEDGQIAKAIYLKNMAVMKQILTIEEVRLGGRDSKAYVLFRKQVMDEFYNSMTAVFEAMENDGILAKCSCGTSIRLGYQKCALCNGAGHCNSDSTTEFIRQMKEAAAEEQPPSEQQ